MRIKLLCSALLMLSAVMAAPSTAQGQGTQPTVVLVVRHGEKAATQNNDPDPSLSEAGVRRAQALVRVAEDAGVSAVYTTQFKRTRETARPLAERLNVPVTALEINRENAGAYPASIAKEILSKHRGRTVLVVGHSNTTSQIVEALSGKSVPALNDATDFDRLFIVVIPASGTPSLIKATYGAQ